MSAEVGPVIGKRRHIIGLGANEHKIAEIQFWSKNGKLIATIPASQHLVELYQKDGQEKPNGVRAEVVFPFLQKSSRSSK